MPAPKWCQAGRKTSSSPRRRSLDILVDGRRIMRVLANRYRADLRQAGMGSGKHSFEAQLPAGIFGRIEVRRSFDQADLALTEAAMALAA